LPRKLVPALVVLLTLLALSTQSALAAAGGADRPYKSSGTATTTFTFVNNVPVGFVIDGTLTATHLGQSTSHSVGAFTGPNTSSYTTTIVSASGDTLTVSSTSTSLPITATTFALTTHDTITGGTGRFAGASGTATATGTATLDPSTLTFHDTFTSSGTISY
jgi:hypothetical protein